LSLIEFEDVLDLMHPRIVNLYFPIIRLFNRETFSGETFSYKILSKEEQEEHETKYRLVNVLEKQIR